jgi:hypothetical protein
MDQEEAEGEARSQNVGDDHEGLPVQAIRQWSAHEDEEGERDRHGRVEGCDQPGRVRVSEKTSPARATNRNQSPVRW